MSDDFQSEAGSTRLNHPRPIYLVVCPVSSTEDEAYKPIAHTLPGVDDPAVSFDPELVPILPAVWYALHLPSTRFDTVDIPTCPLFATNSAKSADTSSFPCRHTRSRTR